MTPLRKPVALGTAMLALVLTLAASAVASPRSTPEQTKTTKSYVFKLKIGMAEEMWTPAQVKAKHPKSGEVMLAGSMGGGMSMGGSSRHVEVAITKRSTGKTVVGAHPTIRLDDMDAGMNAMAMKLPYAMMRGVDEGASDIHYGNNINLVPGHRYKVTVRLNGEQAVFQAKAP